MPWSEVFNTSRIESCLCFLIFILDFILFVAEVGGVRQSGIFLLFELVCHFASDSFGKHTLKCWRLFSVQ